MRLPIRCAFAAATVFASAPLNAQDTTAAAPRNHMVERGDNLWNLAQRYLGNPFLWTELYRLNRDVIEDPHWIYPGEVLRLPGDEIVQATPPTGRETPQPQGQVTTPAVTVAPSTPPAEGLPTSLFAKVQHAGNASQGTLITNRGEVAVTPPPTVRPGEALVAPFVEREGGPRSFGRILKSSDLAGIAQATERYRFQPYDRILIEPPAGQIAAEGERYLSFRLGPILEDQGQIMIPTGIVEVIQSPRSGAPAVGKFIRAFGEMNAADRLIPLDTAGLGTTVRPRRVSDGPSTTIRWISGEPVLPSVQNFIVLGLTSRDGIRPGDEFLLYRPRPKAEEGAPSDPPVPIGRAQVVRATPYGVTAVIIGQEQPAIQEGMPARVSARMP